MNVERLAIGVGGFLVAYVSITVLILNGFDNALMMILCRGASHLSRSWLSKSEPIISGDPNELGTI